jgi:hypothetical protein
LRIAAINDECGGSTINNHEKRNLHIQEQIFHKESELSSSIIHRGCAVGVHLTRARTNEMEKAMSLTRRGVQQPQHAHSGLSCLFGIANRSQAKLAKRSLSGVEFVITYNFNVREAENWFVEETKGHSAGPVLCSVQDQFFS